jgi:CBS domain-containing protein
MPIRDLARDTVVGARLETPVAELARQMRGESVGSVVITNGERPVGIVTDRDLTTRVLARDLVPSEQTAEDVMSDSLCTVAPETGFYEAAEVMRENAVRRLPVCTNDDELVGIVTADDLTELLAEESTQLASIIRAQRPAY